ncbi:hypothetical protein Cgig2_012025 [Carnegiea gigantea]|uniref:Chaperone DnaJ C-terminal domain-containing protein n=1 Tax=Carnegiea gigantea TaxID=171969 RepID=A0A9Q1KQE5_9CARY|nr:hypothetical protein Cgig2_012025 [Carnegiea gigantea]
MIQSNNIYAGISTSINNGTKTQQQGAKTPNNSRATSMNRTFSRGSGTNSFNNGRVNSNTNAPPRHVNRSTSMNISRSTSNNGNVVMSSFRSFNKSRSGHIIMFSNSSGMLKPPAMEQELECTLEELCHGCVKKIRVSRDVYSWTGQRTQEGEVLTVNVKPGWKAGTRITFEGTTTTTDDKPGEYRADVVFIVTEKPHRLFRRNGDDLEMEMEIPLVDALTGCTLTIPLLGGEEMSMAIDDVVFPGYEKVMVGRGMPNQKNPHHKGDLKIKLLVDFPKSLTEERRELEIDLRSYNRYEAPC